MAELEERTGVLPFQVDLSVCKDILKNFLDNYTPCTFEIMTGIDKLGKEHDVKVFTDSWPDIKSVVMTYKEGNTQDISVFNVSLTNYSIVSILNSPVVFDLKHHNHIIRSPFSIKDHLLNHHQILELPKLVRYIYSSRKDFTATSHNEWCLPEGFKSANICFSDFDLIASKWMSNETWSGARDFLYHLLTNYPSVGIYDTTVYPQRLVSWAVSSGLGIIYHLYTLEKYRRKGFANVVIKQLTDKLLSIEVVPNAGIYEDNVASHKLFVNCGYCQVYAFFGSMI